MCSVVLVSLGCVVRLCSRLRLVVMFLMWYLVSVWWEWCSVFFRLGLCMISLVSSGL